MRRATAATSSYSGLARGPSGPSTIFCANGPAIEEVTSISRRASVIRSASRRRIRRLCCDGTTRLAVDSACSRSRRDLDPEARPGPFFMCVCPGRTWERRCNSASRRARGTPDSGRPDRVDSNTTSPASRAASARISLDAFGYLGFRPPAPDAPAWRARQRDSDPRGQDSQQRSTGWCRSFAGHRSIGPELEAFQKNCRRWRRRGDGPMRGMSPTGPTASGQL